MEFEVHKRPRFRVFIEGVYHYDVDKHCFTNKWIGVFIQVGWRALMICW